MTCPRASRTSSRSSSRFSWRAALARGRALLREQGDAYAFEGIAEERLRYFPDRGHFQLRAQTSLDIQDKYFGTSVWFDGRTGALTHLDSPATEGLGNTVTTWLYALHFGTVSVGGGAYRVLVAAVGGLTALLSVSGVWIWWSRRSRRRRGHRDRQRFGAARPT